MKFNLAILMIVGAGAIQLKQKSDPTICYPGMDNCDTPVICTKGSPPTIGISCKRDDEHVEGKKEAPAASFVQTGFWTQAPDGASMTNTCTNANKATGADETCDTAGNSAWNTHTSSRTASQTGALSPPYPGHALH